MPTRKAILLMVLVALGCRLFLLPVLPIADPTEGRYAVVCQEMVLGNDWVTPKVWIAGELIPFLGKPPLFFWLGAGAMKVFGVNAFAARLPSWLAMVALLALLGWVLRRYADERTAWLAVGLTIACPVFLGLGGAVATDMLLALFVAGSVLVYTAFAVEPDRRLRKRWSLLLFALLAGGFMTKGPVALVLFGLPVLAWTIRHRKWALLRDHNWAWGIPLFLGLVVPWFWLCERHNPDFLRYFFVNENFLRFVTHSYGDRYGKGHMYPRGSALVMLLLVTMPWSLYAGWAWWRQRRGKSWRRQDELTSLLFLGFLLPTLFWCLARQLLITYLLPMAPLFCGWLALVLPQTTALWRFPAKAVGGVLAVFLIAGLVAGKQISRGQSSLDIMDFALAQPGDPIVFAGRIPYSAYFYGRGRTLPHSRWSLAEAMQHILATNPSALLVIGQRDADKLPPEVAPLLRRVASGGRYAAYQVLRSEVATTAPEDANE